MRLSKSLILLIVAVVAIWILTKLKKTGDIPTSGMYAVPLGPNLS